LGLKRELTFWGEVAPVVFDYWWHASSTSPRSKSLTNRESFQSVLQEESKLTTTTGSIDGDDSAFQEDYREMVSSTSKSAIYEELHHRNAPRIYNIILELGGLYIKLAQVLSVTALPVPKQYRDLFRTLQSNVPGHEEFENVIKPTLEREFGKPLDEVFDSIDEAPCGSASIGQAHIAKLKRRSGAGMDDAENEVVVKVQYPDAAWKIPADVRCVGEFLQLCVYFGVVDESAAKLFYEEFSRQFLAELDYQQERQNLEEVYESSLDKNAPYIRRGVEIPKVYPDLCTKKVITMSYIPGPKFEEEVRK
jgi:aarF domain-containing kinase